MPAGVSGAEGYPVRERRPVSRRTRPTLLSSRTRRRSSMCIAE